MASYTFMRWTQSGYVPEPFVGTVEAQSPGGAQLIAERKWREDHPTSDGQRDQTQLIPVLKSE